MLTSSDPSCHTSARLGCLCLSMDVCLLSPVVILHTCRQLSALFSVTLLMSVSWVDPPPVSDVMV